MRSFREFLYTSHLTIHWIKVCNGKVENSHKQDDREFYSQFTGAVLPELRKAAIAYDYRWNYSRRVRSLQKRTPNQVIHQSYANTLFYLNALRKKYRKDEKPFLKLLSTGDLVHQVEIKKEKKTKKNLIRQPISSVSKVERSKLGNSKRKVLFSRGRQKPVTKSFRVI